MYTALTHEIAKATPRIMHDRAHEQIATKRDTEKSTCPTINTERTKLRTQRGRPAIATGRHS